ncbi:hypothetical protein Sjap_011651 [Stephania japonica]|uniref:Uncharacterized protein n=1 Tax=Stephania japonica TaxID=461633 RepID=A0AAP0JC05_9MAGN
MLQQGFRALMMKAILLEAEHGYSLLTARPPDPVSSSSLGSICSLFSRFLVCRHLKGLLQKSAVA